jgi:hypothetical protein
MIRFSLTGAQLFVFPHCPFYQGTIDLRFHNVGKKVAKIGRLSESLLIFSITYQFAEPQNM